MRLDRPHTDGEAATSLLIRGAGDNLRQHLAFAPRQQLVAGEIKLHADRFVTIAPTICEGCNGTPNASDYEMGIERLDQIVKCTAFDRFYSASSVVIARYH